MTRVARQELFLRDFCSVEETISDIEAVTAADVSELSTDVLQQDLITMVALGPVDDALIKQIDWSLLE
jgi:predicted Zn-dependent peptidase